MIILGLNKIFIAILLLSVFAVGTLTFMDTVEAKKWTKFDSGSYNDNDQDPKYKKKVSYISYNKGSKDIKMNLYMYRTKNNKKELQGIVYFSKSGNKIKMTAVDKKGKKDKPEYVTTGMNVKTFYREIIFQLKNS